MEHFARFFHLAAAIVWMGGMALMLIAVRPAALATLPPAQRVPMLGEVLRRFFVAVWICIAVLLLTGLDALLTMGMAQAPKGVHLMLGIGLVMTALFGHLYFAPFRRLRLAVSNQDWPLAAAQLRQIHHLVVTNFSLSWLALAGLWWWR